MPNSFQHFLTYQHNVQRYFQSHRDKYDGILIPLSIAVSFPSGTYGFIRALCTKSSEKHYAIDPRTPLFQKKWDRSKFVREPHKQVAQILGSPFSEKGLISPLEPNDFDKDEIIEEIVKNCLKYQINFRTREEDIKKLNKYKKLLDLEEIKDLGKPQVLIPPYFQFDNIDDDWFKISMKCNKQATNYNSDIPIRPVVHFTHWSAVENAKKLHELLLELNIGSYWIYPNDLKEREIDLLSLKKYREHVENTHSDKIKIYTLFGGYFAVLLSYFGLAGFSNGIGYGEWRDSGYHRGGTAAIRLYSLRLHRYLDLPVFQNLIDHDAEYFGGDTDILSACVVEKRSLLTLSNRESLEHFVYCRKTELEFVATNPVESAVDELNETIDHLEGIGPDEIDNYGMHLKLWRDALK